MTKSITLEAKDLANLRQLRALAVSKASELQEIQAEARLADVRLTNALREALGANGHDPLAVGVLCYGCGTFAFGRRPSTGPDGRPRPAPPCEVCHPEAQPQARRAQRENPPAPVADEAQAPE